jgi:hypothetical protein
MSFQVHFESLSDTELVAQIRAGLIDEAIHIAIAEARSRGLPEESFSQQSADIAESAYEGDMVLLERGLSPQEAQVLAGFLVAAGIAADSGDTNIVQANALLSIAIGGASVRVPELRLAEAKELIVAFRRGDFALDDDFQSGDTAA